MSATAQTLPAGTYGLDPVHSTIGFAIKHNGISTFRGSFDKYDAGYEDGVLTGSAQVDSLAIDLPDLKGHLLSEEFFNAEVTPTVTFRSTAIRVAEDGTAEVDGDLTIKGTTKPVTAKGTYAQGPNLMGSEVIAFELEAVIDRREFGLNWQAPLPNGNDVLAWDVALQAHLELIKA
jgi:polyisoprenoid-binding protein YceI